MALKRTKRGASTTGRAVSKKGKVGDAGTDETNGPPDVDATTAVSEAKSSKSNSQSRPSHGPSFSQGIRQSLAIREMSGKPTESLILNECFTDFMEVESSQEESASSNLQRRFVSTKSHDIPSSFLEIF